MNIEKITKIVSTGFAFVCVAYITMASLTNNLGLIPREFYDVSTTFLLSLIVLNQING